MQTKQAGRQTSMTQLPWTSLPGRLRPGASVCLYASVTVSPGTIRRSTGYAPAQQCDSPAGSQTALWTGTPAFCQTRPRIKEPGYWTVSSCHYPGPRPSGQSEHEIWTVTPACQPDFSLPDNRAGRWVCASALYGAASPGRASLAWTHRQPWLLAAVRLPATLRNAHGGNMVGAVQLTRGDARLGPRSLGNQAAASSTAHVNPGGRVARTSQVNAGLRYPGLPYRAAQAQPLVCQHVTLNSPRRLKLAWTMR
jgi:hypothetical protein